MAKPVLYSAPGVLRTVKQLGAAIRADTCALWTALYILYVWAEPDLNVNLKPEHTREQRASEQRDAGCAQ